MNTVEIKAKLENVFKSFPISREQKEALFDIYIQLMNAALEGANPDMTQYAKKNELKYFDDVDEHGYNKTVATDYVTFRKSIKYNNSQGSKNIDFRIPYFTGSNPNFKQAGLVIQPEEADTDKFLKGDGTWDTPTDTKYNAATKEALGLVKQAATIAPLEGEDEIATVISTVNTLIANLKSAGIISNS